jgi:eukaryotic-like serine/threonine-protein kinase
MALEKGTRLGPYEVVGPLGAGGMGEVYSGRDTRLERAVALKVLPSGFASGGLPRARFEREARAISALQHPHICTLYDVGEQDGQAYLVMERLEGETLADRLKRGALPVPQALEAGAQIADALAVAHQHGIVHRDLKPGNVMLTKVGVKLLDFGLARLASHGERPVVEVTSAPTEATPLTGQGTILGTLPYMAPEQLEGKAADARTDLWGLGVTVYEMVSGRRAFDGKSQVSLMGAILEREPVALASLQPLAPGSLERLIRRCLAKSPDDRWQSAHDVADELRWIAESETPAPAAARMAGPSWRWGLAASGLVVAGAILGGFAARRPSSTPVSGASVVRSQLAVRPAEDVSAGGNLGETTPTAGGSRTAIAWAPDGRALVFIGHRAGARQLYVRDLDRDEARPLPGTEGAHVLALSPDGRWVAFWAAGAIRSVPLAGGPPAVVVDGLAEAPCGMAFGADGRLFYDSGPRGMAVVGGDGAIWSVDPERKPTPVTKLLDDEISHNLPLPLPGGRSLIFTARHRGQTWGDEDLVAVDLASGERKILLRDATDARYLSSGQLLFLRRGTLFGVAFDQARLELRGTPVQLLDAVAQALVSSYTGDISGAGQLSVSSSGALAFLRGAAPGYSERTIVAVDRTGRVQPLNAPPRSYLPHVAVSPDGRLLAVATITMAERTLWVLDINRGNLTRLTSGGEASRPVWTPDGRHIAFWWLTKGRWQVARVRADAVGEPELLGSEAGTPSSWSPDGRRLLLVQGGDIWMATVDGASSTAAPLFKTPQSEQWPEFSPDGNWIVYGSNVSGRDEVYVQSFPGPGPSVQVSLDGGSNPAWNRAGNELYYVSPRGPDGRAGMMAVDIRLSPKLVVGPPRRLFSSDLPLASTLTRSFSVSPDGKLFYTPEGPMAPPSAPVTQIELVQGWTQELTARLTARSTP